MKKGNLLSGRFWRSRGAQRENKRKQKNKQMLGPCQRTKKAEEHEGDGDGDTNCC